jgi:hypothetical protein
MKPAQPEECALKLGDTVKISQACRYADDFRGEYRVVGLFWEYLPGEGNKVNVTIANEEEIRKCWGSTDGFAPSDFIRISE